MVEAERSSDLVELRWERAIDLNRQFGDLLEERGDLIKGPLIKLFTASGIGRWRHRSLKFKVLTQDRNELPVSLQAIEPVDEHFINIDIGGNKFNFDLAPFRLNGYLPPSERDLELLTEVYRRARRVLGN